MIDTLKAKGNVRIDVIDMKTGRVKRSQVAHNIVTRAGLDELGRRMCLEGPVGSDKFAVGTGTTAATIDDAALANQVLIDTMGTEKPATASTIFQYLLGGSAVDGLSLTEAGIFDADGVLLSRVVHNAEVKGVDEAINYTWTWGYTNALAWSDSIEAALNEIVG